SRYRVAIVLFKAAELLRWVVPRPLERANGLLELLAGHLPRVDDRGNASVQNLPQPAAKVAGESLSLLGCGSKVLQELLVERHTYPRRGGVISAADLVGKLLNAFLANVAGGGADGGTGFFERLAMERFQPRHAARRDPVAYEATARGAVLNRVVNAPELLRNSHRDIAAAQDCHGPIQPWPANRCARTGAPAAAHMPADRPRPTRCQRIVADVRAL